MPFKPENDHRRDLIRRLQFANPVPPGGLPLLKPTSMGCRLEKVPGQLLGLAYQRPRCEKSPNLASGTSIAGEERNRQLRGWNLSTSSFVRPARVASTVRAKGLAMPNPRAAGWAEYGVRAMHPCRL